MKRVSKQELFEFANAIREAGGGNSLDALLPGEPSDSSKCLIARNLNFGCEIRWDERVDLWYIKIPKGAEIIDKLVDRLGLGRRSKVSVWLPEGVGEYANDFDRAGNDAGYLGNPTNITLRMSKDSYANVRAMWEHLPVAIKDAVHSHVKTKNGNLKEWRRL